MPKPDHNGKTFGGDLQRRLALSSDVVVPLDYEHHDSPQRHQFGTAFEIPTIVSAPTAGTGSTGSAEMPARADHSHPITSGIFTQAITLTGTIPTSGNLSLGSINVAAVSYDRYLFISAHCHFGATNASFYQIAVNHYSGLPIIARANGGNQWAATISTIVELLPANAAVVVSVDGSYAGGTSATAAVSNDLRFNRLVVWTLPA